MSRTKPKGYDAAAFPSFAVTVDMVVLTVVEQRLMVLLIERGGEPFKGMWALPGGFKRPDESLDAAAARELQEEAGTVVESRLVQFRAYGEPGRDPRTNVVTVAYLAVIADLPDVVAGSDAARAKLWPADEVLNRRLQLAFDHHQIVEDAVEVARRDLEISDLALAFVGEEFTLSELRAVYEAIWGVQLEPANFRRSLLKERLIVPTGRRDPSGTEGGRPAERFVRAAAWSADQVVRRPR